MWSDSERKPGEGEGLRAPFLSPVLRVVSMLVNRTGRLHPQDKSLFADRVFVVNAAAQSAPVIPLSQGCFLGWCVTPTIRAKSKSWPSRRNWLPRRFRLTALQDWRHMQHHGPGQGDDVVVDGMKGLAIMWMDAVGNAGDAEFDSSCVDTFKSGTLA